MTPDPYDPDPVGGPVAARDYATIAAVVMVLVVLAAGAVVVLGTGDGGRAPADDAVCAQLTNPRIVVDPGQCAADTPGIGWYLPAPPVPGEPVPGGYRVHLEQP